MKRFTSIKTRITAWYTTLMFILIAVILIVVGISSYRLSVDNVEKDVVLQVTQVSEKLGTRKLDVFASVDNNEEFKNVSIYREDGEYIVGQYIYDVVHIAFKEGAPHRETVDGKTYIVYDVFKHGVPGEHKGFWIRGVESLSSTMLLGRSVALVALIAIPVILLLTALGGYYITKKAFLQVNNITKAANEICVQNDISRRIEIADAAKKDELHNLSVTLNRMLDKIEHLVRQEQQFTADASHELRTPISVILAQGEYLLDITENEKEKELAENIVAKAKQVSTLISELLLLARIDRDRQKIHPEKVNLGALTDIATDSLKSLAEEKEILIFTDVSDALLITADEALLLSVLTNLISNGIKYGRKGGYVSVSASKIGAVIEIVVADNGIGIEQKDLSRIWDRFYRADNVRNDAYGSSGLGLAMVQSIVKLHGGKITVESERNCGTIFRIQLNG